MITLVLDCVDRLNVYNTAAHFSEYAGEEAAESWKEIVNLLYELLGKSMQGFPPCIHFDTWLITYFILSFLFIDVMH